MSRSAIDLVVRRSVRPTLSPQGGRKVYDLPGEETRSHRPGNRRMASRISRDGSRGRRSGSENGGSARSAASTDASRLRSARRFGQAESGSRSTLWSRVVVTFCQGFAEQDLYRERQQSQHPDLLPEHDAQIFHRELSQRLASQLCTAPHKVRGVRVGVRPPVPFKLLDGRQGDEGSPGSA